MKSFDMNNYSLRNQFKDVEWIENSGVSYDEINSFFDELMTEDGKESRAVLKAKLFAYICENSRIAIDKDDIFQDKIFAGEFLDKQRYDCWATEVEQSLLVEELSRLNRGAKLCSYTAGADFGHTSPNSKLLLELGFAGLLERVEAADSRVGLTQKQKKFYESCKIVLGACITACLRLADGIAPYNSENEKALRQLAVGAPTNTYEAMQLLVIYFFLHEWVLKTRVRTLGRLDVLLYPFYKKDLEDGRFTKNEIEELIKFFFNKFAAAEVPYGLPFCLGGIDEDGREVTNELSYLLVKNFQILDIYSVKIHIRVSDKTPKDFVMLALDCIRRGQSSFVFCNDRIAVKSLMDVGIEERDARDYTPIGCYEPAVWGKEIGCTGNSSVNMAKAIEYVLSGGVDTKSGELITVAPKKLDTFEDFMEAVKEQIAFMAKECMDYVCAIEKHYDKIGPDPLLSCMYEDSVERGVDVMEGGAKYNNSSVYFYFIATLVDSLTAIKKLVYDEKRLTLSELYEILKKNWQGNEKLRQIVKKMPEKYGNENETADAITNDLADFCGRTVNNKPNARGGVFKASLFTIDKYVGFGKATMATPDGRFDGELLSKNLCASVGMDKNGILALINSVTDFDHAKFPNGSVFDVMLHPSAVMGEDGLDAFYGILKTYLDKGGFALHANVFNSEDLRKAQKNPEKYSTLQVRVCGWNAYFVTLTKEEQDAFIRQAENVTV